MFLWCIRTIFEGVCDFRHCLFINDFGCNIRAFHHMNEIRRSPPPLVWSSERSAKQIKRKEKYPAIDLDIFRCAYSHNNCAFQFCCEKNGMHNITNIIRYGILKDKRFYIPIGTLACSKHIREQAWNNIDNFRMNHVPSINIR